MRLVLWNCNGGIGSKEQSDVLKSLSPDVAVIPEMRQSNIDIFSPNSAIWKTNNRKQKSPKGLGVISFNGFHLDLLDYDEEMEIYLPIKIANKDFKINLLAVWNFYFASKQGRFRNVKGPNSLEYEAIKHYTNFLKKDCIVAGDWNLGPTFYPESFLKICHMFNTIGIHSLYHKHHSLNEEQSNHFTFRGSRGQLHHLDHIFGSDNILSSLRRYEILPLEKATGSDHAPIIIEFLIP